MANGNLFRDWRRFLDLVISCRALPYLCPCSVCYFGLDTFFPPPSYSLDCIVCVTFGLRSQTWIHQRYRASLHALGRGIRTQKPSGQPKLHIRLIPIPTLRIQSNTYLEGASWLHAGLLPLNWIQNGTFALARMPAACTLHLSIYQPVDNTVISLAPRPGSC